MALKIDASRIVSESEKRRRLIRNVNCGEITEETRQEIVKVIEEREDEAWRDPAIEVPCSSRDVIVMNDLGIVTIGHWWDFEKSFWNGSGKIKDVVAWKETGVEEFKNET